MKRGAQAIRPEDVDDNYPIVPDGMVERCNELIRRSMLRGTAKFYYFDFHESFGPFDPHVVEQLVDKYHEAGWDVIYPTVHDQEPFIFTKPVKRIKANPVKRIKAASNDSVNSNNSDLPEVYIDPSGMRKYECTVLC